MAVRKWRRAVMFVMVLFMGLLNFYRVAQSPQFDSYRTIHVIQLVVSGACLGAALTGLFVMLLRPRCATATEGDSARRTK